MDHPNNNLSVQEIASIIRSMIEHENALLNQRIGWLIQLQGFLFAALSFAWDKKDTHLLGAFLSIVGIAVSLASISNMWIYFEATKKLKTFWKDQKPDTYKEPDIVGFDANNKNQVFLAPMCLLPFVFIAIWLLILFTSLVRS